MLVSISFYNLSDIHPLCKSWFTLSFLYKNRIWICRVMYVCTKGEVTQHFSSGDWNYQIHILQFILPQTNFCIKIVIFNLYVRWMNTKGRIRGGGKPTLKIDVFIYLSSVKRDSTRGLLNYTSSPEVTNPHCPPDLLLSTLLTVHTSFPPEVSFVYCPHPSLLSTPLYPPGGFLLKLNSVNYSLLQLFLLTPNR